MDRRDAIRKVDHAGRPWRVHRALGPDAVLLTNDAGEILSVAPAQIDLGAETSIAAPARTQDERRYTDAQWAEASRRRDLLAELGRRSARSLTQVDDVAKELGVVGGALLWFMLTAMLPWGGGTWLAGLASGGRWNAGEAMMQDACGPSRRGRRERGHLHSARCQLSRAAMQGFGIEAG